MTLTSSGLRAETGAAEAMLLRRGFVRLAPRRESGLARNELWVPQDVASIIHGETIHPFPDYRADGLIARFVFGYYLAFSLIGDPSSRRPEVERLARLDEAWAICFRSPRPGWRLFGRFYGVGAFVGTRLYDRNDLGTEARYESLAAEAVDECHRVLPGLEPVRGETPNEYWHGVSRDVDEEPLF